MFLGNCWDINRKKYVIVFLVFVLIIVICSLFFYMNKNKKIIEEWVDITDFSNTLEIQKEWKLLSYPEVDILSESDWEIMMLNIEEWDFVQEWDILMQIWNDELNENTLDNIERQIWWKYSEFYENSDKYNEFEMQYWWEIAELEEKLLNDDTVLKIAKDMDDKETVVIMEKEIQDINQRLINLKRERDNLKWKMINLEDEIQSANKESINLYYEFDKQIPRSTIEWIVWNVYVKEWDEVKNWDKLCTIINNNYIPEISVWLDFNEYILTQDLTWVMIITENVNRWNSYYEWEIYTRSPILNEEWKYTITVRILEEDVPNLILSDKNTKITVIFSKDFSSIWMPKNCFKSLWNTGWLITLRDGDIITWREVWIKNIWEEWINIDNLVIFWFKEEKKDNIDLCIENWNNVIKNWDKDPMLNGDESLIEWRNQFDNVEYLCEEFVKINPMYWTCHENVPVGSLLWWSGERIEVLCKLSEN